MARTTGAYQVRACRGTVDGLFFSGTGGVAKLTAGCTLAAVGGFVRVHRRLCDCYSRPATALHRSTLSAVLPVLTRRDSKTIAMTARLWGLVLVANIAGRLMFAALLQIKGVFSDDVVRELKEILMQPVSGSFIVTVVRALFADWLIALMVWLLPSARSARLTTILLITYASASVDIRTSSPARLRQAMPSRPAQQACRTICGSFFAPTLLGNMLGGISLVAIIRILASTIVKEWTWPVSHTHRNGTYTLFSGRDSGRLPV